MLYFSLSLSAQDVTLDDDELSVQLLTSEAHARHAMPTLLVYVDKELCDVEWLVAIARQAPTRKYNSRC